VALARRQRVLPDLTRSGGFIGMSGLACVLFLDVAAAGPLRWWAVAGLVVVWLVLFWLGCRWFVPRPRQVMWLPLAGLVIWVAVVFATVRLG
jgi:FtsH-binding integral membrane protein